MSALRASLALWSVVGAGCGALDDFEAVIVDEATLPGTFQSGALPFPGLAQLSLSGTQEFTNRGVGPDDVDGIFVKSIRVEGKDARKDDLGVLLESITLRIAADGLEERVLGRLAPVPRGPSAELTVDPTFNLKEYAIRPKMTIRADVVVKQAPLFQTTLKTTITLNVDINLLGV